MARRHCSVMASPDHDVSRRGGDVSPHRHLEDQTDHLLFFCHLSSACSETLLSRLLVASQPVRDLLICAKHLFIAARRSSSQRSFTRHLNRGVDGVFEVVRVVGRGLVPIAEVHAIVTGAQLAQGKPEMARNRFGFLERHEYFRGTPQGIRSVLRTAARCECVPLTFDAGVVSLQLMKRLAMSRTINHMNPPATVPHITGADT